MAVLEDKVYRRSQVHLNSAKADITEEVNIINTPM